MTAFRCAAAVALAVLAVLAVAACGSSGTKERRSAVNMYFGELATAQVSLLSKQGQINETLQRFSLTRSSPSELERLRSARRDIGEAVRRVAALHPPSDARILHHLVLERLVLQRSTVDELIATALYIPKLAAIGPALQAAADGLRRDLAAITSTPAKPTVTASGGSSTLDRYAAAFGGYGDALAPASAELEALDAPPIMRPALDAERRGVARSITLCATIRRTVHRRDIPGANAAIHSLFTVAATINGAETQSRQAAAARAYDARLRRIDRVAQRINRERDRLVRVIG